MSKKLISESEKRRIQYLSGIISENQAQAPQQGGKNSGNAEKKIEQLANLLRNVNYPIDTGIILSEYFERVGRFAEGYQVLIKLSTNPNDQEEMIKERIAYLERVLANIDGEFVEGWRTRVEIRNEIAILQGKMGTVS